MVIVPQPSGVVATFTPGNYSVILIAHKLAAALAAGCPMILKGAEGVPECRRPYRRVLAGGRHPRSACLFWHSARRRRSPTILKIIGRESPDIHEMDGGQLATGEASG
ncbi:aldehyde dehydrogenase family protein [Bradyrhizobium archetypum]|uniref:Aldehyde dehydrogenase family protein n=1 Tax=Bradyrhizobium archetypum TaxID=2721160 RepID=A0A7Y4GZ92_9BRAD|nr:aldehyde dehydrogenase family protein [Bradyrhizobium archetypum]